MKLVKFFEFKESDLEPVKSFRIKDNLNPRLWDAFELDIEVRENLLKIAQDFYNSTDLEADIKDVILTGSLANYNWSEKYSDYDLHILIDFRDVNDDIELVKKYCDSVKNIWNKEHDITIKGYEVEVYIQDINEPHKSTGIFSLLNNKWRVRPEKIDFEPDEDAIAEKAKSVMMMVDDLEDQVDEDKYEKFIEKVKKVWEKVKNYRKSGLESEGGEFSLGNLVFKLLRRNGYINKVMKLKRYAYDKQFESSEHDNDVLRLLYLIDDLDKTLSKQSDESWSQSISYTYDEDKDYIDIHYSSFGFSEGFSDDLRVFYKETPIRVIRDSSGNTVFGDYDNNREEKYNSFEELIDDIKDEFGL
jgi:hypothetical protein